MSKGLNPKQQLFVKEYLATKNATRSVLNAGYQMTDKAASVQGVRMLANANIKAEVEKGLAKQLEAAQRRIDVSWLTKERWLDEVSSLAFSDITDAYTPNEDGKLVMSMADIKARGLGRMIKKIRMLSNGRFEFELQPKIPALDLIAKHFGWIKEHHEHSGQIGGSAFEPDSFQRIVGSPEAMKMALALAELTSKPNTGKEPGEGESK